jgi:hypothetical protein
MNAQILDTLTLLPVVELEPASYARATRSSPMVSHREDPSGWQAYWLACLADAGITDLVSIHPGSWLVSTARLGTVLTLRRLIEVALAKCELPVEGLSEALESEELRGSPLSEWLGPLSGGCVVISGGLTLAEPSCCGDIGDLAGWRAGVEDESDAWHSIWTGHGGVSVSTRNAGRGLRLDSTEYELRAGLLRAAIDEASQEVSRFEARLRHAATGLVPAALVEELVICLARGSDSSDP